MGLSWINTEKRFCAVGSLGHPLLLIIPFLFQHTASHSERQPITQPHTSSHFPHSLRTATWSSWTHSSGIKSARKHFISSRFSAPFDQVGNLYQQIQQDIGPRRDQRPDILLPQARSVALYSLIRLYRDIGAVGWDTKHPAFN